jgi:uncharacterized protein (TIGR01777 family)
MAADRSMGEGAHVLVTGASGPIGAALLPSLRAAGARVKRMVRGRLTGEDQIQWDPERTIAPELVSGFDAVIHLAGESILGRWTKEKKKKIRDSRVHGTRNLAEALARAVQKPGVLIVGSATGYYGDRGEETLREESASGSGFLPEVCREWEAASQAAEEAGVRVAHSRTGIVLSTEGGALGQMLPPFRLGVGGRLGSGRQWMSWIHVDDMVGAIHHILRSQSVRGPVNMVAPNAVRNAEFTRVLAGVLSRPAILPVPAFGLRLLFGQMADEALLASQRVEPVKLAAGGYAFRFAELKLALQSLLTHP